MLPLSPIQDVVAPLPSAEPRVDNAAAGAGEVDFEGVLRAAVDRVNAADLRASQQVEALAAGATDDIHGTMIAVKEAEIGVKLVGSIRTKLLDAFQALLANGHTIIIVEHNMDVIKCADWVIDLGPEGGEKGGNIVFEGKPEELAMRKDLHTGRFLAEHIK